MMASGRVQNASTGFFAMTTAGQILISRARIIGCLGTRPDNALVAALIHPCIGLQLLLNKLVECFC